MTKPPKPTSLSRELDAGEIETLRELHYNATVIERLDIHDALMRIRIRPDDGFVPFSAGQYVALGLGYWEPRIAGSQAEELNPTKSRKLVRRAYSISCPIFDPHGQLVTCNDCDLLEFYIALIRHGESPPELTPRLFLLSQGDRLFVQPRICGSYVLQSHVSQDDDLLFLGTGTGEAPHNAMVASALKSGHRGRVVVATCSRHHSDFGYLREHKLLSQQFPNYCYLRYTTREPENVDPTHPRFVGSERLQIVYRSGRLAEEGNISITPQRTHVYLCGNPQMIGLAKPKAADKPVGGAGMQAGVADPLDHHPGMLQLLLADGFRDSCREAGPGAVYYEKYW